MTISRRVIIKGLSALAATAVVPSRTSTACDTDPTATDPNWYGSGHIMTGLGNTTLIADCTVTQSFRAIKTGFIRSIRWYAVHTTERPGYSLGTGGNIRVRIEGSDAQGRANDGALGGSDVLYDAASGPQIPNQVLSLPAPVDAGKIYHVTFTNIHPNADNNFVSTDCINIKKEYIPTPHNPQIPDIEDSVYYRSSRDGNWIKRPQSPILDLEYTDGTHQGTPYMAAWRGDISSHHNAQVTSTQWTRQNFTPPRDITANAVAIAARKVSGPGSLIAEIQTAGGTVLRRVTWDDSEILTDYQGWAPVKTIAAFDLLRGSTYRLVLKATSGTFTSYPLQNGSVRYGFSPSIAVNGFCEYSTNSGASWSGGWKAWDVPQRRDGTLVFYFLIG